MADNFSLITDLQLTYRPDYYLADRTLLNPHNSNPIVEGEWLELDTAEKLVRGTGGGKAIVYPVHMEQGRSDSQVLGKLNVIMMNEFVVDTKIVNTTALVVGDAVKVGDVTIGGLTKRGLLRATGGVGVAGEVIVGHVTKLFAGETKARIHRTPAHVLI